jgi:hypothetical protein
MTTGSRIALVELKTAAEAWHKDGATIIPVYISETADPKTGCHSKNCGLVNWGKWIKQPQTKEEFNNLPWQGCNGFAVLLGYQDHNDYFFTVADFDPKCTLIKPKYDEQTYQENKQQYEKDVQTYQTKLEQHNAAVERGQKLLADLPPSRVEHTVNGGCHVLFKSRKPVTTDKTVHTTCKIEILTEKQLCIMAPSFGYTLLENKEITVVDDFNITFQNLCTKYDLPVVKPKTSPTQTPVTLPKQSMQRLQHQPRQLTDEELQPIVEAFTPVWVEGKRNYLTEYLCGWFINKNIAVKSAHKLIGHLCNATNTNNADATEYWKTTQYQYANRANKPDLKGWTGLLEVYQDVTGQPMSTELQDKLSKNIANDKQKQNKTKTETADEGKQQNMAEQLYKLFQDLGATLFHNQNKTCFAQIPILIATGTNATNANNTYSKTLKPLPNNNLAENSLGKTFKSTVNCVNRVNTNDAESGFENLCLEDKFFRSFLTKLFYDKYRKFPSAEAITQVITLLNYHAKQANQFTLYNRVAPDPSQDGTIWIDTADPQNRAIHITKNGWTIKTTDVPTIFHRYSHQQPLPTPISGGDVKKLLPFLNVGAHKNSKNSRLQQTLLMVQIASYGIPNIAHPIIAMYGSPGTHKSTVQSFIRRIWDPSSVLLHGKPPDRVNALQTLDHHYIVIFDNIDYPQRWFSDMLCCAVTGTGIETRALYTNDDSFIRSFHRCILLNGLNLPATLGDLLSRIIMHPTEPTIERHTLQDLETQYAKIQGEVLGGFLDAIVQALKLKENMQEKLRCVLCSNPEFRLADFTEWGYVLAEVLGYGGDTFIEALRRNLESQQVSDIENNPVADCFLKTVNESLDYATADENNPVQRTPEELYRDVTARAEVVGVNVKSKRWPGVAQPFVRKLNESKAAIVAAGWNYESDHDGKKRVINLWRITKTNTLHNRPTEPNMMPSTQEKNKTITAVEAVKTIEVLTNPSQYLSCCYCEKPILEEHVQDSYTWDKPAHINCYKAHFEQLKNHPELYFVNPTVQSGVICPCCTQDADVELVHPNGLKEPRCQKDFDLIRQSLNRAKFVWLKKEAD